MITGSRPLDFEVALARLEEVVSRLESGELTLADSLRTFEEGIDLSRQCADRLNQVEARIDCLIRTANGEFGVQPFPLAGEAELATQ
jgi:exodeoxyribonuclease VII small subunit